MAADLVCFNSMGVDGIRNGEGVGSNGQGKRIYDRLPRYRHSKLKPGNGKFQEEIAVRVTNRDLRLRRPGQLEAFLTHRSQWGELETTRNDPRRARLRP